MLTRQLLGAPATLQAATACVATAPALTAGRLASSLHGSGKEPRDAAGSLAKGPRSVVQGPLGAASALPDDAPMGLLQRVRERAQDLMRPAYARGHAYHYAEDSARAVLKEQLASCQGQPALGEM